MFTSFGRPHYYILDENHNAIPATDLKQLEEMYRNPESRRVAWTDVYEGVSVSTVFLGIDHNWGAGPPLLFETMVFGGHHNEFQQRYTTWEEAKRGHQRIVDMVAKGG